MRSNSELARMGMMQATDAVGFVNLKAIADVIAQKIGRNMEAIEAYTSGKDKNEWNVAKTFIPFADDAGKDLNDLAKIFNLAGDVPRAGAHAYHAPNDFRTFCRDHDPPLTHDVIIPPSDDDRRELIINPFAHPEVYALGCVAVPGDDGVRLAQAAWRRRFRSSSPYPCRILITPEDLRG